MAAGKASDPATPLSNTARRFPVTARLRILQMVTVRWYNACAEYAVRLSAGLAARGHDVTLLGYRGSPPVVAARRLQVPVVETIDLRPGRLDGPAMAWRLTDLLRRRRIQVVNAHRSEDHLFGALAAAVQPQVRLVRTRGDVRPPRQSGFNRVLYERRTDAHVMAAAFMRDRFYPGFRIPPARLVLIPPALDIKALRGGAPDRAEARRQLDLPATRPLVGLIGRWTANKGILGALEAFARVHAARPETLFVLAGEPYDLSRQDVEERVRALGLSESLRLLPRMDDVRPLMRALDLGVVASVASEAICRVAMEFLTLATPVVGTAVNSIPEMVTHGEAGWIVPPADPEALAAGILHLLGDDDLRRRLAAGACRVADDRFDLDRQLDQTEALYARLLAGTP